MAAAAPALARFASQAARRFAEELGEVAGWLGLGDGVQVREVGWVWDGLGLGGLFFFFLGGGGGGGEKIGL